MKFDIGYVIEEINKIEESTRDYSNNYKGIVPWCSPRKLYLINEMANYINNDLIGSNSELELVFMKYISSIVSRCDCNFEKACIIMFDDICDFENKINYSVTMDYDGMNGLLANFISNW